MDTQRFQNNIENDLDLQSSDVSDTRSVAAFHVHDQQQTHQWRTVTVAVRTTRSVISFCQQRARD